MIKLAREAGIYGDLTDCILDTAVADSARFRNALGRPLMVSVNISPYEANDEAFVRKAVRLVEEAGLQNSFCLEVTEEAALERFGKIAENLHNLFGHGILAAIDDFSMGQTSLKYLQGSNFQFVKLDGALVRQLLDSPRSQDIVRAIVGLGQDLNFQVVAEYVESRELRDLLLSLNCRIFQGYLYSPAVPPAELVRFVLDRDSARQRPVAGS